MSKSKKLDQFVATIRNAYKRGITAKALARKYEVSMQAIYNVTRGSSYPNRNGKISRRKHPMTQAEIEEAQLRYAAGESIQDIASTMRRSYQCIYYWLIVKPESEAQA